MKWTFSEILLESSEKEQNSSESEKNMIITFSMSKISFRSP